MLNYGELKNQYYTDPDPAAYLLIDISKKRKSEWEEVNNGPQKKIRELETKAASIDKIINNTFAIMPSTSVEKPVNALWAEVEKEKRRFKISSLSTIMGTEIIDEVINVIANYSLSGPNRLNVSSIIDYVRQLGQIIINIKSVLL